MVACLLVRSLLALPSSFKRVSSDSAAHGLGHRISRFLRPLASYSNPRCSHVCNAVSACPCSTLATCLWSHLSNEQPPRPHAAYSRSQGFTPWAPDSKSFAYVSAEAAFVQEVRNCCFRVFGYRVSVCFMSVFAVPSGRAFDRGNDRKPSLASRDSPKAPRGFHVHSVACCSTVVSLASLPRMAPARLSIGNGPTRLCEQW